MKYRLRSMQELLEEGCYFSCYNDKVCLRNISSRDSLNSEYFTNNKKHELFEASTMYVPDWAIEEEAAPIPEGRKWEQGSEDPEAYIMVQKEIRNQVHFFTGKYGYTVSHECCKEIIATIQEIMDYQNLKERK